MNPRLLLFITSFVLISLIGFFIIQYAKGLRFDIDRVSFAKTGILVVTSNPDGAQVLINGQLKTATNSNLNLTPGNYDVQIVKEGFLPWQKRLTITDGVVTKADALLFPKATSLSPLTFFGANSPILSPDRTKLSWIVPKNKENPDKVGIWVIDLGNLPFGFVKEAKQVSDVEVGQGILFWSPDNRNLVLKRPNGTFLLEPSTFTAQEKLANLTAKKLEELEASWKKFESKKLKSQLQKLPQEMADILNFKTTSFEFSPDETKVLYTASASAVISDNLAPPLPGASTQPQQRTIKSDTKYAYDIKEDRNFLIDEGFDSKKITWLPNSRHLLLASKDQIAVMEYEGTNKNTLWTANYQAPLAFLTPAGDQLIILTNLGSTNGELPNLYAIKLR